MDANVDSKTKQKVNFAIEDVQIRLNNTNQDVFESMDLIYM